MAYFHFRVSQVFMDLLAKSVNVVRLANVALLVKSVQLVCLVQLGQLVTWDRLVSQAPEVLEVLWAPLGNRARKALRESRYGQIA